MSDAPGITTLPAKAARLMATEILLADPEALGDDVLESCLYLLRDRLQGSESDERQAGEAFPVM
jgi:hypothetical protein